MLLRVDGRLENAELPTDTKHPLILPGRHPLTRLIILFEHVNCGHAGPSYTLMKTHQRYWIIHGIVNVKHFIADCGPSAYVKPSRFDSSWQIFQSVEWPCAINRFSFAAWII